MLWELPTRLPALVLMFSCCNLRKALNVGQGHIESILKRKGIMKIQCITLWICWWSRLKPIRTIMIKARINHWWHLFICNINRKEFVWGYKIQHCLINGGFILNCVLEWECCPFYLQSDLLKDNEMYDDLKRKLVWHVTINCYNERTDNMCNRYALCMHMYDTLHDCYNVRLNTYTFLLKKTLIVCGLVTVKTS